MRARGATGTVDQGIPTVERPKWPSSEFDCAARAAGLRGFRPRNAEGRLRGRTLTRTGRFRH